MSSHTPKLSIIIVNWNTKDLLADCITSIKKYTSIPYEIIVSDNGSTDGSLELLKTKFPKVKLIENRENLGFSKGNNAGIHISQGEYVMLLNSDTKLDSDTLTELVTWLEDHPQVGICGPKLLNRDGSLQPSAGYLPNLVGILSQQCLPLHALPLFRSILPILKVTDPHFYQSPHPTGWVSGACFLIRRAVIDQIQGLDESIFMYMEEVEFCRRAQNHGWQVWINPQVTVWHLERGSSISGKKGAILGVYRGLYHYFRKHQPAWQLPILHLLLKCGALLRIPKAPHTYLPALKIS